MSPSASPPMIQARKVSKDFDVTKKFFGVFGKARKIRAVVDVDLDIFPGETVALVGESGCGKSTLGRLLLRLVSPTGGSISAFGENLLELGSSEVRKLRRQMQMIFQDPFASLNPRMTVRAHIEEPMIVHRLFPKDERLARVKSLLNSCGISDDALDRFPHEFSGGQRQRISIARALAVQPRFVVCDEPVSALDVSIQAQVLQLLKRLQKENQLTYLMISHDLRVVGQFSDRVFVMYFGRIVEAGPTARVFERPTHPYTRLLLSSRPVLRGTTSKIERMTPKGELPSPFDPPSGCAFHPRCPLATEKCRLERPELRETGDQDVATACHYPDALT